MEPGALPAPRDHIVGADQAGRTLESVVRGALDGMSWSRARELCASGRVTVDGDAVTDPSRRVAEGARITVDPTGRRRQQVALAADAILHVDRDIVIVRKPAGVVTAPYDPGDKDTLVDLTRDELRRRTKGPGKGSGKGYDGELGVVSRLDKDTTGLVVFARTPEARRHLEAQFSAHTIERRYLAIAHGLPPEGRIESTLIANRGDGIRGSQGRFAPKQRQSPRGAQRAISHFRVMERLPRASLVECRLETGRQHQIRIHLAEAGCPLVGETTYLRDFRGDPIPAPRPMLHAAALGFEHPRSGRAVHFEDPLLEGFLRLLSDLRSGGLAGVSF